MTNREIIIRRKADLRDDPRWFRDPNEVRWQILTPTDGDYVFQLEPLEGPAPPAVTFTRSGESGADTALGWAALINAAAVDGQPLATWVESSDSDADFVRLVPHPTAPKFTISLTPPAPSLTPLEPDDTYPICTMFEPQLEPGGDTAPGWDVAVHLEDSNGVVIDAPVLAYGIEAVRRAIVDGQAVTEIAEVSPNQPAGRPQSVLFHGPREMTVRLSSITGMLQGQVLVVKAMVSP